ncbi:hypothetical protein ANN_13854 [Periplaneta americana]|uniref:Transposase n=1 Tax=Periplaneta americana TaxID=6978 RepID=A0ABQ8SVZ6_PERAM|nr:hypothetical protein ANN_13854 [Periplaneta americana]
MCVVKPRLINMADGREMRLQLIALIEYDFSAQDASRTLSIPRSTAQGWALRFRNHGEVGRSPGSGCPRISTRVQDEVLNKAVSADSFRFVRQLQVASVFPGCSRKVLNRLRIDYN